MKIAILGTPGYVPNDISTELKLKSVGQNTGNLVFQKAVSSFMKIEVEYINPSFLHFNNAINQKWDLLIFPAANHINQHINLEGLTNIFEKINCPVLVLGIGAQFDNSELSILEAKKALSSNESLTKFLECLKHKAIFISTRGGLSSEILNSYGITNECLGCPSLFLNKDMNLGEKVTAQRKTNSANFLFNVPAPWRKDKHLDIINNFIFTEGFKYKSKIIQQSGGSISLDFFDGQFSEVSLSSAYSIYKTLKLKEIDFENFIQFIKIYSKVFFDFESWAKHVNKVDFIIGTRMHGQMIGLSQNIFSVILTHDSRTEELANFMKTPSFKIENIENIEIQEIKENTIFSGSEFDDNRNFLAKNYNEIFKNLALPMNINLSK